MRHPIWEPQCERDLKRMLDRGKDRDKFLHVVFLLKNEGRVPIARRPHKLSGKYERFWECHIESDWLLIYQITTEEVVLARTGTHADLFE